MTRATYEEKMLTKYNRFLHKCCHKYCRDSASVEDSFQNICMSFLEWLRKTAKSSLSLEPNDGAEFEQYFRRENFEKKYMDIGIGFRNHKVVLEHGFPLFDSFEEQSLEEHSADDYGIEEKDFINSLLPREQDVVNALMQGYDEVSAANNLHRGYSSVRRDLSHIRQKYIQYFGGVA